MNMLCLDYTNIWPIVNHGLVAEGIMMTSLIFCIQGHVSDIIFLTEVSCFFLQLLYANQSDKHVDRSHAGKDATLSACPHFIWWLVFFCTRRIQITTMQWWWDAQYANVVTGIFLHLIHDSYCKGTWKIIIFYVPHSHHNAGIMCTSDDTSGQCTTVQCAAVWRRE